MKEKMRGALLQSLRHFLLNFLMASGLVAAFLRMTDLWQYLPFALMLVTAACVLLSIFSMSRATRIAGAVIMTLALGAWLLAFGGARTAVAVVRACFLEAEGTGPILVFYEQEAVILFSLFLTLLALDVTSLSVSAIPAVISLLSMGVLIWQYADYTALLCLVPSVCATIATYARSVNGTSRLAHTLPVVILISLSLFLVPQNGVTVQPLRDFADEVRQRIMDYLFFTEPRNVFTLASEGYYPKGQSQLGGPASPTQHPVMTVRTPKDVYLRGSIRNEYTGRTWLDTSGGRRFLWVSPSWQEERNRLFDITLPRIAHDPTGTLLTPQELRVQMIFPSASSLFVPQRLRDLTAMGSLVPYFNQASEVFATRDLQEGDAWSMTALLLTGSDPGMEELVSLAAAQSPELPDSLSAYLSVPSHLQESVWAIAREAAGDSESPFKKALSIQNYLKRHYTYTLTPEEMPENLDFVSYFLLSGREGYCTYFASAMTILCRMAGLPARYVEGYLARPGEDGIAHVTGMDGHAWTEVYFAGFGWVTFDATPSEDERGSSDASDSSPAPNIPEAQQNPESQSSDAPAPAPTPQPTDVPEPSPEPETAPTLAPTPEPEEEAEDPEEDEHQKPLFLIWLFLILLLLLVIARTLATSPTVLARLEKKPERIYMIYLKGISDLLRAAGLPRQPSESYLTFAERLDEEHLLPVSLLPVGESTSRIFYRHEVPGEEDLKGIRSIYLTLCHSLSLRFRVRLWWMRLIGGFN